MEILVATAIGVLTAAGILLILQRRSYPVILGLALVSHAVNIFLAATARLALNRPPILGGATPVADPLPQALVLTAIVISFGMTAVLVMMAIGAHLGHRRNPDSDSVDMPADAPE